ncbi:alcohol dehydrogenase catalytic domain-containing protein [Arthrobacter pascens]|uniref:alcohol dehydrogenase catalytic domain-containing protein n=1 Tax=Arthrobacter pascens TaxID=1677 RepID=UPI00359015D6
MPDPVPAEQVIAFGPGVTDLELADSVVVYHISGCGLCRDCRLGYQISCTSSERRAHGWQRGGGHSDLLVTDSRDLLRFPDSMTSIWTEPALPACGFGIAYEALLRLDLSGRDRSASSGRTDDALALPPGSVLVLTNLKEELSR